MPTFELTAPNGGGTYQIDAPDEHAAVGALQAMLGGSKDTAQAAPAPQAAPAAPAGFMQRMRQGLDAPTRALENGLLGGLGDRARGLIDSIVSGGNTSYSANLAKEQGDTDAFAAAHPIANAALGVVGGALAPVGVVGAAGRAATLGGKIAAGAGTGAAVGAVQGALGSKDYTDPAQVAKDAALGGIVGGGLGTALPVVGAGAGAAYRGAANYLGGRVEGMSRAASGPLVSAMEADGPAAVQQRMQQLGPDAMLADAGPSLRAHTQAASLASDEGRSIVGNALKTRDLGTNSRIQSDVDAAIGPAQDQGAQSATDAIRRVREEHDAVNYPAALDTAPPVKIAPIMSDLVDRISQAPVGSPEHKALSSVQTMLTKKVKTPLVDSEGFPQYDKLGQEKFVDVPMSHDDAGILHKTKVAIDNVIEHNNPGLGVQPGALNNQQGSLKQVRFQLNNALEQQVPNYAAANDVSAALAKRVEAVQAGTQVLGNGKTVATPQRFAQEFSGMAPGEQIALAKGLRSEVDRAIGTKSNDLQALRGELQGEGGWNGQKLSTVYGQPAADALTGTVDRNLAFRETHQVVNQNSQTAQRLSALAALKPTPATQIPLVNPNMTPTGFVFGGLKKGYQVLADQVKADSLRHASGELASTLTAQGAARDAKINAIIQALGTKQGNAAAAGKAGTVAQLLTALAASGANNFARRRDPTK